MAGIPQGEIYDFASTVILGADIVEAIDREPKLCDHIHLPVQSGSTKVLRAMARTYTREEYLGKIGLIRGAKRPISITTDIMWDSRARRTRDFEETLRHAGRGGSV